jgi:hypothetical protein
MIVPSLGSIVYNVRVGDRAFGWVAENVNPGVSIRNPDEAANVALHTLACVGNEAVVMTGSARGARGVVTGKSGLWGEHVIIDFSYDVLNQLVIGDNILVRAYGVGLKFVDHPEITIKNLSPSLLGSWSLEANDSAIRVPVAGIVPPELVGAGSGLPSEGGVLDIQSGTPELLRERGLADLRIGDIVAFEDCDATFNSGYHKAAITVGVISQGDSQRAGFGPGVTLLMTSRVRAIEPVLRRGINIGSILGLSRGADPPPPAVGLSTGVTPRTTSTPW